jgi:hypothetical protein
VSQLGYLAAITTTMTLAGIPPDLLARTPGAARDDGSGARFVSRGRFELRIRVIRAFR